MGKKDKFKFINKEVEKDFLLEDQASEEIKKIEQEEAKTKGADIRKRNIYGFITMGIISVILFFFGLSWQAAYDLMAICNALWLAFAVELLFGWSLFVYNKRIFAPLVHGLKTFFLMIVGKRPKLNYFEYNLYIQDNQVPSFYYNIIFIWMGIIVVPATILTIILL